MPKQLSRHSLSLTTLPAIGRSLSQLRLTRDEELGSPYSTKSLSSSQRGSHSLRQPGHTGKTRTRYNYLDDIEVHAYVLRDF